MISKLRVARNRFSMWLSTLKPRLRGAKIGQRSRISRSAFISNDATIGNRVTIDDGVRIGPNVKIGDKVQIESKVIIKGNTIIKENTKIDQGTIIDGGKSKTPLVIGNNCYVGMYNILDGSANLSIGNHVHIASPGVGIWTHSTVHHSLLGDKLQSDKNRTEGKVSIGDNVYIGGNTTIQPNVEIGNRVVVLPNSAVSKNIESNLMVGGVPAKPIRKISVSGKVFFKKLED